MLLNHALGVQGGLPRIINPHTLLDKRTDLQDNTSLSCKIYSLRGNTEAARQTRFYLWELQVLRL